MTTFVQQLDAQGPAVVQRISTHVGDLACSQDTMQQIVDALHTGKSVKITSTVNGKTESKTFNASGAHLGYGEAYIAVALAAQQLRNAGVTSCATPDQWHAVLLGGNLEGATTTTTTRFPGIVTLHTQGQGWGQIARTSNLELNQVISGSAVSSTSATAGESALTPTGMSSAEMNRSRETADASDTNVHTDNGKHKGQKKHWWSRDKDKDDDKKNDKADKHSTADETPASSSADHRPDNR